MEPGRRCVSRYDAFSRADAAIQIVFAPCARALQSRLQLSGRRQSHTATMAIVSGAPT
jgi:hypothetical protein